MSTHDDQPRADAAAAPRSRISRTLRVALRIVLLVAVPVVAALAGLEYYVSAGRTVSTENAYVKAGKVAISSDLAGRVAAVHVSAHGRVERGDLLFTLDARPFEIAFAQADARLSVVEHEIEGFRAVYRVETSELEMAGEDVAYYEREFERQRSLAGGGLVPQATIDESLHDLRMARRRSAASRERLTNALARLGGDPSMQTTSHPHYLQALAARDAAALDLQRTAVRAPVAGVVSALELEPGEYVEDGQPVFSIVEDRRIWVTANLKETELSHIQVGGVAQVRADAFPDHGFAAEVESIAPATGAEFSLLPPQNASGNWVKVVQRLPVRLRLLDADAHRMLRVGMSVEVRIDTGRERQLPAPLQRVVVLFRAGQDQLSAVTRAPALTDAGFATTTER